MARLLGTLTAGMGAVTAAGVAAAASGVRAAIGGTPDQAALLGSPQFRDGAFRNLVQPQWLPDGSGREVVRELLSGRGSRRPTGSVPLVEPDAYAPTDGLHLTWYGHASSLVELDGARVLLDPVWGERASPSRLVGPKRLHPVPHRLADLPALDAVVVSHDHYDHLDMSTVRTLARTQRAPFVVPLGVGAHLRAWGVPDSRIIELDWGDETTIDDLRIVATPAQHFSGRAFSRNNTLWASWVIATPAHRVFYSGDTGYCEAFNDIGERHGPFDVTLVQVGAYASSWPDIHMTPEEGVATHLDVRGQLLVPVHWATFNLAPHSWTDPVDRVWKEAKALDVSLAVPKPGQRIAVAAPPPVDGWWQTLT
ncbi:L-ascorbate metabolism protein UlaG (beta-lactamase superfamily) [Saccharomonospora amisosensis]|uniref:L-ascorbate metabolism protein UlaG (Beta-lactamase superfamily) n=1 Tax=Saccharomonospora amisosensis TaxID=1128677 RepID=A0A7X5URH4_9PSEU|nr:MBL fold metallo-hydrolase [Saccharomonospora amisosensis]NIJ12861.1 L-ascorbate metabolism protein UlaG (beta-lactamase superfamily) [Saccharomonospora amisosensis]